MKHNLDDNFRSSEAGFTLAELLVVMVILGIIGYGLTQAVILGLKTTNGTANRVAGSSAAQALDTYFFGDVQSTDQVSTSTTSATDTACGTVAGVLLHLAWTDQNTGTDVFYAFDPPSGGEQSLVRITCVGTSGAPDRRVLGHFSHDPAIAPVTQYCGADQTAMPCTATATAPAAVTLVVQSDPAAPFTNITAVRRRPLPT